MSKATEPKAMYMRWPAGTPVDAGAPKPRQRAFWGERIAALGALLAERR
jgi:hypothetical protein